MPFSIRPPLRFHVQCAVTWFVLALTIVVLSPPSYALAQEPDESAPVAEVAADSNRDFPPPKEWYEEPTKNLFALGLGLAIFPSLGNTEFVTTTATANHPGHVSFAGFALETAYHRHIAHWERGDLYLGGEFGAFFLATTLLEIPLNRQRRRPQVISMRGYGMRVPASSS